MKNTFNVIKRSGEIQEFNIEKLKTSLLKAKTDESLLVQITDKVLKNLTEGMTTKQIYKMAYSFLKENSTATASRYKLKKALMQLGPSGFPFEKLIGQLLAHEGFHTEVGVFVQGNCVQHEVDVIAQKDNLKYMIECKYHSDQNRFCNVKIPLYIQSRFIDVEIEWKKQKGHEMTLYKGWVYTNTRFTADAIQYGTCVGLGLASWDYPKGNGIKERIDKVGMHPLTALTTLTKAEKTKLMDNGVVLCKELYEKPAHLDQISISAERQKKILEDCQNLSSIT